MVDVQHTELAPLATRNDKDGIEEVADFGEVEQPEDGGHARAGGVELVTDWDVLLAAVFFDGLNDHVCAKGKLQWDRHGHRHEEGHVRQQKKSSVSHARRGTDYTLEDPKRPALPAYIAYLHYQGIV